jgi:hypothetical protein
MARRARVRAFLLLFGTGLRLAAVQVFPQRAGEALGARGALGLLGDGETWRIGHRRIERELRAAVNHSSIRSVTLAARITATACFAAYSAD